MPPLKTIEVDIYSTEGIILFKEWINKTFPIGTILYFQVHRIEDLTEDITLNSIEAKLSKIFNATNYRSIVEVRKNVFTRIFYTEVDFNTANLIVDFWQYFYSIAFFEPMHNLTFEEFEEYEHIDSVNKNLFGQSWLWHKLADRVYLKNVGGEELIISSFTFNV